jgi:hypothetical protein
MTRPTIIYPEKFEIFNQGMRPDEADVAACNIYDLEDELDDLATDNERTNIILLRAKILNTVSDQQRLDYAKLIKDEVNLFWKISTLKSSKPYQPFTEFSHAHGYDYPVKQFHAAQKELYKSLQSTADELRELTIKILKSPPKSVVKEISLLNKVVADISEFYNDPFKPENYDNLLNSAKALHSKVNPIWSRVKTAVAIFAGLACIVAGLAGAVPTFGASIALIAVGSMICGAAGVSSFKFFAPKIAKANDVNKQIQDLLSQSKKILALDKNPKNWIHMDESDPEREKRVGLGRKIVSEDIAFKNRRR